MVEDLRSKGKAYPSNYFLLAQKEQEVFSALRYI